MALRVFMRGGYEHLHPLTVRYGDELPTLVGALTAPGSRIADPETIVHLARAETGLGGAILRDFADVADVPGAEKVLNNLAKAPPHSAKGYAFEAEMAATLKRLGHDVDELSQVIRNTGIPNPNSVLEVDARVLQGGETILYEFKAGAKVSADEAFKNKVLRLKKAVLPTANGGLGRGDEARIVVSRETHVTAPALNWAKQHGIQVFREPDLVTVINP